MKAVTSKMVIVADIAPRIPGRTTGFVQRLNGARACPWLVGIWSNDKERGRKEGTHDEESDGGNAW